MAACVTRKWCKVLAVSLILMAGTVAPSAAAQSATTTTVSGRLLQRDGTTALAHAIVELRAANGDIIRSLSGADGTFRMTISARTPHAVRVLRVGYLPFAGPSIDPHGRDLVLPALIVSSPQVLLAATTQASRSCTVDRDQGMAVATAWEEARKAMLSTTLRGDGERQDSLEGEWMTYDRLLDAGGRHVRSQRVAVRTHFTQRVFRSAPVDSILRQGFLGNADDGIAYHLPDADVLLSPLFTAGHCFELDMSVPSHEVHVRFTPAPAASLRYDVTGTAVLDRASGQLTAIRFRYTGLPDTPDALAGGGNVQFTALRDGRWVVSSWMAQLPLHRAAARTAAPGTRAARSGRTPAVVTGLHQTGGSVRLLRRASDTLLLVPLPALRVQLTGTQPSLFAGIARVMLDSTTLEATVDSTGLAVLTPMPAGMYTLRVAVPLRDSLGAQRLTRVVAVREPSRDSRSDRSLPRVESVDTIRVPDVTSTVRDLCPSVDSTAGSSLLRGRLRLADGSAGANLRVVLDYLRADARGLASTGQVRWTPERRESSSDEVGRFTFCGVPRNTDLRLEVNAPSLRQRAMQRLRIPTERMNWSITMTLQADSLRTAARTHPWLRIDVVGDNAAGIADADVRLRVRADSTERRDRSDQDGRVYFREVPFGRAELSVQRVGYAALVDSVDITANTGTIRVDMATADMARLRTVRTEASQRAAQLVAFEQRAATAMTSASILREEIERRAPVSTWQLLTRVGALRITSFAGAVYAASSRGDKPSLIEAGKACPVQVFVDGNRLQPTSGDAVDLTMLPPPQDIHGIEVYAGAARIPAEFAAGMGTNTWCGVIAVWTRDR